MKKLIILSILLLGFSHIILAKNAGLSFLKIGVGARATALGEAYTAIANDATAPYWNPAGTSRLAMRQVIFSHNEWFQDISNDYVGVVYPSKRGAIGFSLILNNVSGLERRTIASQEPLGEFGAHDVALGMTYARSVSDNLRVGASAKYLYEKIYIHSASGFALDVGAQYDTPIKGVTIGGAVQNMGRMNTLNLEKIDLPLMVRGGVAWHTRVSGKSAVLLALDVVSVPSENTHINIGAEYLWQSRIALRSGYQTGFEEKGLSAGFGLRLGKLGFDYAFVPFDSDIGNTHRLTLGFKF